MTFKQFRETPAFEKVGFHTLTLRCPWPESEKAIVLQWEPSNRKWYAPEPHEGRQEVGYLNDVRLDETNFHVIDIR